MISAVFAEYSAGVRYDALPQEAVLAAKRVLLDWLGNVYAGAATPTGKIIAETVLDGGTCREASAIGFGCKSSALNAALVNGACCHIVEFDDVYRNAIFHPGAPTIAAALAVAQKLRADGRALIAAIVAGYEVGTRIAEAVSPSHYKYWHTTGTVGTFGAAAAAGNLLGLSSEQMLWAFGNAGTQAAGLWQFNEDGQMMTKSLHAGRAATSGVLSALLAKRGFNGATRILEGEKGFCAATAPQWSFEKVLATLGRRYNIALTSFKAYASCSHTHSSIDATLALAAARGIRPSDVRSIRVRTYEIARAVAGNPSPETPQQAKFSIPYCVAIALRCGKAGAAEFTDQWVHDEEVRDLVRRVEVVAESELSALAPARRPAIVEITTTDGRTCSHREDFRKGDPENPPTQSELETKFCDLASARLSPHQAEEIIERVSRVEQCEDVTTLV